MTDIEESNRAYKAKQMRYKRSALESLGWEFIRNELWKISEACDEVRYYFEDENGLLLAAMDGDEEEENEFKMAFTVLSAKCERLEEAIREYDGYLDEDYDSCTVALIGNRYKPLGWDGYEEDYYSLSSYEQELAQTAAGKRVCRWTKTEMVAKIGQCMGIALAFYDLRHNYDYLQSTMDILRGENFSILQTIKKIEEAYARTTDDWLGRWNGDKEFEELLNALPDCVWVE